MSHILSGNLDITYTADGVPITVKDGNGLNSLKKKISQTPDFSFKGELTAEEINVTLSALSNYRKSCASRLLFDSIAEKALRDAFVTGSGIIHTFWEPSIDKSKPGDIGCEVLSVNDVYFGDSYETSVQKQPFIIISSLKDTKSVINEMLIYSGDGAYPKNILKDSENGKILVLTKLYKAINEDGKTTVFCTKVTRHTVVRNAYDTGLSLYPIALFNFNERRDIIYGESEVTYLIPNQIAINRMITANVWAGISTGMPIMVVNGDVVSGEITNEPGQIIKVFGSPEDVKNAVGYVSPPDSAKQFRENVDRLIENTLTQSGATSTVLGDTFTDNATALITMRNTALSSLNLTKLRFYGFMEEVARIWADFFLKTYGNRKIRVEDENGIWYFPFSAERYGQIVLSAKAGVSQNTEYSDKEKFEVLTVLFDKGVINKKEYLKRIPECFLQNFNEIDLGEGINSDTV